MTSPQGRNSPKWWKTMKRKAVSLQGSVSESSNMQEDDNIYEEIPALSNDALMEGENRGEFNLTPFRRRSLSDTCITSQKKGISVSLKKKLLKCTFANLKDQKTVLKTRSTSKVQSSTAGKANISFANARNQTDINGAGYPMSPSFIDDLNARLNKLTPLRSTSPEADFRNKSSWQPLCVEKVDVENVLYSMEKEAPSCNRHPALQRCSCVIKETTAETPMCGDQSNQSNSPQLVKDLKQKQCTPLHDKRVLTNFPSLPQQKEGSRSLSDSDRPKITPKPFTKPKLAPCNSAPIGCKSVRFSSVVKEGQIRDIVENSKYHDYNSMEIYSYAVDPDENHE